LTKSNTLQVKLGVNNIFNSFQKDFDQGVDRDSGYIYGPTQPRTFYLGLKLKI
jgi:outer membrane receptor for ferrienterochelin and colicins